MLSCGYAQLPDGLKFVFAVVALLAEGNFDVITTAPNQILECESSENGAISMEVCLTNAMPGLKAKSLHIIVLDKVLGLLSSNFSKV